MSSYASPDSFGLGDAAIEQAIARQLATFMPIAIALPCFDDVAPEGWIIFEGQATPADAPQLLAHYGATLPDMRGRVPVGKGTHADVAAVLEVDGLPVASRSPRHNSTVNELPHGPGTHEDPHHHSYTNPGRSQGTAGAGGVSGPDVADVTGDAVTGLSVLAAVTGITVGPGGVRPTDEVPFIVCNWIAPYR